MSLFVYACQRLSTNATSPHRTRRPRSSIQTLVGTFTMP